MDGPNWYAYCANSPLMRTDPTGLDTLRVVFNQTSQEMVVYLDITSHSGETATVQIATYNATCNPQPLAAPTATTIPSGDNYYPQSFPTGTWNVLRVDHPYNNDFGQTEIVTDASQQVTTYTQNEADEWVATGTAVDQGYAVHGGGYSQGGNNLGVAGATTSSPQGVNSPADNTYGCIRLSNENANELGNLVQTAIDDKMTVTITVEDRD